MNVTEAHVRFARQVSDGNYGSETISVDVDISHSDGAIGDLTADVIAGVLHELRERVEGELARSPNWSVQRGVEYPKKLADAKPTEVEDLPF